MYSHLEESGYLVVTDPLKMVSSWFLFNQPTYN